MRHLARFTLSSLNFRAFKLSPMVTKHCFTSTEYKDFNNLPPRDQATLQAVFKSENDDVDSETLTNANVLSVLQIMRFVQISSLTRDQIFKAIIYFSKAGLRKSNFTELMLMGGKLADYFISETSEVGLSPFEVGRFVKVLISLANLNLKSTKCFLIVFKKGNQESLFKFFDSKFTVIYIPNFLSSLSKLSYELNSNHLQVIERLMVLLLQNESGLFLQKKANLLSTLFLSEFKSTISSPLVSQAINYFTNHYEHRTNFNVNFNTKFASIYAEFFCQLIPKAGEYIRKYNYVPDDIACETPFDISNFPLLVIIMNKCLQIIKLNSRSDIDFHPVYIEGKERSVMLHKKVSYGNPTLYEKLVADYLTKMGHSNIKASQIVGMYEIDLLIDNETIIKLNGNKHYIWKLEENRAKKSIPFVTKTNELIGHEIYKDQILQSFGFKKILNHSVAPNRALAPEVFAAEVAKNIDLLLKTQKK